MPENLTRREFFKELGMMGGVAAAGSFALSEGQKLSPLNRPSWIKEVDKPTVEIDWDQIQRYNEQKTAFSPVYYTDTSDELNALSAKNNEKWLKEERDGWTLKDRAVKAGWDHSFSSLSLSQEGDFVGPSPRDTPEKLGVPKWTGTPEEAARIVSAAMRFYGAASVGFIKMEPETTEKLLFANDGDGKIIEYSSDVDVPTETEEKRLIPQDCRTGIVFTVQMSRELWRRAPSHLGSSVSYMGYEHGGLIQNRTQMFLKALGYNAPGEYRRNALGTAPGFAVMAGLGEMARYNRLITPEYGPTVRVFKLLTNLDIAPTKPIDAGLMNFCRTCKKCAEMCPSKSISFDDEPSWETTGPWNNPGIKTWYDDAVKCRSYWYAVGGNGCGICFAYCPFADKNLASFHKLQAWTAGNFPALNSTMRSLDDFLYTPNWEELGEPQKSPDAWYDLDLPEFGIDTTRAKKHGNLG
jgi:reductive dehalogenase